MRKHYGHKLSARVLAPDTTAHTVAGELLIHFGTVVQSPTPRKPWHRQAPPPADTARAGAGAGAYVVGKVGRWVKEEPPRSERSAEGFTHPRGEGG